MAVMRSLWIFLVLVALATGKPTQPGGGNTEDEEETEGVVDQRSVGSVDPNLLAHGGEAAVHDAINEALNPDAPLEGVPDGRHDETFHPPSPEALQPQESDSEQVSSPPGPINPESLLHEGGENGAHHEDSPVPVGSVDPEHLAHGEESVHEEGHKKEEVREVPVGATNPEQLVHGKDHVHGEKPKVDQDGVPVGQADPEVLVHGQGHVHHVGEAEEIQVPVGATDPETLVHGEAHAHEEKGEKTEDSVSIGSVNPEHLAHEDVQHGEHGQQGEDLHENKIPFGSVDPESLLHGDEGGHVHRNPKISLEVDGRTGLGGVRVGEGGVGLGGTEDDDLVHRLMHGEEPHQHAEPAGRLSVETLKQLNLDPEVLKNMDMSKLFDTMQQDYQEWQKDIQESKDNVVSFEITSENLMEELVDRYHLNEKARVLDPRATDEWEAGAKDLERPDKDEDSVQHRLEMAANTEPLRLMHRHNDYKLIHKHMHEDP